MTARVRMTLAARGLGSEQPVARGGSSNHRTCSLAARRRPLLFSRAESGQRLLACPRAARLGVACRAAFASAVDEKTHIHPTAVVHPDAKIGEGVEIGPFCTVSAEATIGAGSRVFAGAHFYGKCIIGEKCTIHSGAVIGDPTVPGTVVLGSENTIGCHAVVGVRCQDLKYTGGVCSLELGDRNDVREHVSLHLSSREEWTTKIGDDNLIMGSCHIAHDCIVGNRNIFANASLLAGHVEVADHAHFGGATAIHQFCQIGTHSFIAGGSIVVMDVPAYVMVQGDRARMRVLNQIGLQRFGYTDEQIATLRKAYRRVFSLSADSELDQRLSEVEAEEEFSEDLVKTLIETIRASKRGICSWSREALD